MADTEDWKAKMLRESAEANALLNGQGGENPGGEEAAQETSGSPEETKETENNGTVQKEIDLSELTRLATNDGTQAGATPAEPKAAEAAGGGEDLAQRVKELEAQLQRERSENGRARALADELKRVKAERDEMASKVSEYEKQEHPVFQGDVSQFSETEVENMSPEFRDMLGSRFGALQARQAQLEREIARSQQFVRENEQASLKKAIAGEFPGLGNSLTSDAWQKWCRETDPVTQQLNGDLFLRANERFDRAAVSSLIRRFSFESGVDVSRLSGPGAKPGEVISSGDRAVATSEAEKVYKNAEVAGFMNAVISGQLDLSDKGVAERYRVYKAAIDSGRIVE